MSFEQTHGNTELWATIFGPGHPELKKQHRLHRLLPRDPRCRLCMAPFSGLGGWIMARRGKAPSSRNRHYCNACDGFLKAFPGGAEVEMSMLYVDIRNSVATAEAASPTYVSERLNRFLTTATQTITDHDGFIMAFYGDCVVAVWPPGFSGEDHAGKAVAAARALCAQFGGGDQIPAGVGVHNGPVYIGTVEAAQGAFRDISIFGHAVNLTARLAGKAPAGRALVSEYAAKQAGLTEGSPQSLDLKGVSAPQTALCVGASAAG